MAIANRTDGHVPARSVKAGISLLGNMSTSAESSPAPASIQVKRIVKGDTIPISDVRVVAHDDYLHLPFFTVTTDFQYSRSSCTRSQLTSTSQGEHTIQKGQRKTNDNNGKKEGPFLLPPKTWTGGKTEKKHTTWGKTKIRQTTNYCSNRGRKQGRQNKTQ